MDDDEEQLQKQKFPIDVTVFGIEMDDDEKHL
jgi:hypothetical protein